MVLKVTSKMMAATLHTIPMSYRLLKFGTSQQITDKSYHAIMNRIALGESFERIHFSDDSWNMSIYFFRTHQSLIIRGAHSLRYDP